jgi:hypothetical protein
MVVTPSTTSASADFCRFNLTSQSGLPLPRPGDRSPQVSALTFPAHRPHLLLRLLVASDFVVSGHLVQPHSLMRFVFLRSQLCLRLPSDTASRQRPCPQLAVGATSSARVFHPLVNAHAGRTKQKPGFLQVFFARGGDDGIRTRDLGLDRAAC